MYYSLHISFPPRSPGWNTSSWAILSDAHELVGYLKESFGKEKIYLLGHSWGTILGALLASRYPEDFHAYIGMGQWVSMGDNERLCYEFTLSEAERRGDRKAVALLERIGAPENGLYRGDWLVSVGAQRKYLKCGSRTPRTCPSFEEPDRFQAGITTL